MQSQKSSTKTPLRLPWRFGSMVWRGRGWWITWRDPAGNILWANAGTDDACEARRILAVNSLPRARAMVAALEAIAHGKPYQSDAKAGVSPRRAGTSRGLKAAG